MINAMHRFTHRNELDKLLYELAAQANQREHLRKEIALHTHEFLQRGGRIQQLPNDIAKR